MDEERVPMFRHNHDLWTVSQAVRHFSPATSTNRSPNPDSNTYLPPWTTQTRNMYNTHTHTHNNNNIALALRRGGNGLAWLSFGLGWLLVVSRLSRASLTAGDTVSLSVPICITQLEGG